MVSNYRDKMANTSLRRVSGPNNTVRIASEAAIFSECPAFEFVFPNRIIYDLRVERRRNDHDRAGFARHPPPTWMTNHGPKSS